MVGMSFGELEAHLRLQAWSLYRTGVCPSKAKLTNLWTLWFSLAVPLAFIVGMQISFWQIGFICSWKWAGVPLEQKCVFSHQTLGNMQTKTNSSVWSRTFGQMCVLLIADQSFLVSHFFWSCFPSNTRQKCQVFISSWSPKHDSTNNHQTPILITWAIPPPQMFPRFLFPQMSLPPSLRWMPAWPWPTCSSSCDHTRVLYLKTGVSDYFSLNFSCVHQMLYLSFIASYLHCVCFWLLLLAAVLPPHYLLVFQFCWVHR